MEQHGGIRISAPAKVNVRLDVTGKRPDGYHDLFSVMQALELADELTVRTADAGITISCDDPRVPSGPDNIIYRAAERLLERIPGGRGVSINLVKRVPMAAGLGGGSSDAASTLKAIDLLFGLDTPADELRAIAKTLGADVPFFLYSPTALAEGIGELLTGLTPPEDTWLVLVNPGFAVPTKWVYDNLNLGLTNPLNSNTLPPFVGRPLTDIEMLAFLHNDLERVTAGRYPLIDEIKDRLTGLGAKGAMMSGSGPTVFGIFPSRQSAQSAVDGIKAPGWTVVVTRTISAWPEPEFID